VLGGVYRYLLQRATAVGRLAEQQLAFERQAPMPGYIKSSYWSPAAASTVPAPDDVRGLTGSARLLQDLTRLEEYAAETDRRRLQLTETVSLAMQYPIDLQRFRETGVLPFATPMSLFESRLPGIFMATIRRVRVSLVALIPPTQGIRATLTNGGTSRVVVEEDGVFRSRTLHTLSDTVALTSPINASGVFDLDLQPELLLPFEGAGVDTTWELRLPKAANSFDFRTIADIIIGIDYTALYSPGRAAEVIRRFPARQLNSIAFSLRRDFPDGWYDLMSSAETQQRSSSIPLIAVFPLSANDFPPNLADLGVDAITLLIVRRPESTLTVNIDHLYHDGPPADPSVTTPATSVDGIVSTRNGAGASWVRMTGPTQRPDVTWEFGIVANQATLSAIARGELEDLVLNLDYTGALPPWPG
jgi:hypothetical protein